MAAKHVGAEFVARFGTWAVIAGGSDGIGAAYARELAQRGLDLALIARRRDPLDQLAATLRRDYGVQTRTVCADLTSADVGDVIADATNDLDVGLFVYNAGSSRVMSKFTDLPLEEALFTMHLNCRGPLVLSKHFAGRLRARGRGGLILMSSLACLSGGAYTAVYSASKAFVTTLAEGLWHELAPHGVDVLGVVAGATKTESMLHDSEKFADAMDPGEVAASALDHLGKGPNWIPGAANQQVARAIWPMPRVPLINGLSEASAALFDLPHTPVEGQEFHEG